MGRKVVLVSEDFVLFFLFGVRRCIGKTKQFLFALTETQRRFKSKVKHVERQI